MKYFCSFVKLFYSTISWKFGRQETSFVMCLLRNKFKRILCIYFFLFIYNLGCFSRYLRGSCLGIVMLVVVIWKYLWYGIFPFFFFLFSFVIVSWRELDKFNKIIFFCIKLVFTKYKILFVIKACSNLVVAIPKNIMNQAAIGWKF